MQELARKNNMQFEIRINNIGSNQEIVYEVVKPGKKFLNKEGRWNRVISRKAQEFLIELEL